MSPKRKQGKTIPIPIILIVLGGLLLVAAAAWALPRSQEPLATAPAEQAEQIPYPEIERVTLADARTAYANDEAIFLDVRDASAYEASHVPGALSIPLSELENRLNELNRAQWIITYCT